MTLPNLPDASVPVGKRRRPTTRKSGARAACRRSTSSRKPHWDLGPALGILDFERATRMSGARFSVLHGRAARAWRAR